MEQPTKREVNSGLFGAGFALAVALIIWGANWIADYNTHDPELVPITQAIEKLTDTQAVVVETQSQQSKAYGSLARSRARTEVGLASSTISKLSDKPNLTMAEQRQLDLANERLDAAWKDLEQLGE